MLGCSLDLLAFRSWRAIVDVFEVKQDRWGVRLSGSRQDRLDRCDDLLAAVVGEPTRALSTIELARPDFTC